MAFTAHPFDKWFRFHYVCYFLVAKIHLCFELCKYTFDFQQELLWNGDALEVLEPKWLRKEMAGMVKRMWNNYNKK